MFSISNKSFILFIFLICLISAQSTNPDAEQTKKPCDPTSTNGCTRQHTQLNEIVNTNSKSFSDPWISGFVKTFIMIMSMEIGDKTFFIGAILAMSNDKKLVFLGSVTALVVMCVISCVIGVTAPILMSRNVTVVIAAILFVFFGVRMIIEGIRNTETDVTGEYEEAEESVRKHLSTEDDHSDVETGLIHKNNKSKWNSCGFDNILIKTFIMVFLAEWGDRSQFSTLILASTHPVTSVIAGATCGYIVSTLCGVLGGNFFAKVISPRVVSLLGGVLFLLFAVQILITKD